MTTEKDKPASARVERHPGHVTEDDVLRLMAAAHGGWACFASAAVQFDGGLAGAPPDAGCLLEAEFVVDSKSSTRVHRVNDELASYTVIEGEGTACIARTERRVGTDDRISEWLVYWRPETTGSPPVDVYRPWISRLVNWGNA